MSLISVSNQKPIHLQLQRDLIRTIKRGHCWVYKDALRELPHAETGVSAILHDNRGGREIGRGYYDPVGDIALRICTTRRGQQLDDSWAEGRIQRAVDLRLGIFDSQTTAYRLFNGEGDGLPGMVCDRYAETAVLSFDGQAPYRFWNVYGIARWLVENLGFCSVYERTRTGKSPKGRLVIGQDSESEVNFLEYGVQFTADLIHGQKTGFYLDQRENRRRMRIFSAGKRVLNLFGYTGGFSVCAGVAGADHVTTVDSAQPALLAAEKHWVLNGLDPGKHAVVCSDVFQYLETAVGEHQFWDMVILDPPSFASSSEAVLGAISAYKTLISRGALLTRRGGVLAAASCSSRIDIDQFIEVCQEGLSKARLQAQVMGVYSQPADHPVPLGMPEFRYLKFVILRIDC